MSREAAVAFLATVAADAHIRAELDAHLEDATDEVESFVEFATQKGHSFTPADLAEALAMEGEIGEEELDRIAGGLNPQPEPPGAFLQDITSRYSNLLAPSLFKRGFRFP